MLKLCWIIYIDTSMMAQLENNLGPLEAAYLGKNFS